MRLKHSDIAIACGVVAVILFGHIATAQRPARATPLTPLLLQGGGTAYGEPVDERLTEFEYNCRRALLQIGAAEVSYSTTQSSGNYAYLRDLVLAGYFQPNATGRSLAPSYSVTFYLPPRRDGFTLIAEPADFSMRSFMLTENQRVVPLTPTLQSDPDEDWEEIRETEAEHMYSRGYYDYVSVFKLITHDPPLQVRLNQERTSYVILSLMEDPMRGWVPDDSLVYISSYTTYMLGDTRILEEFEFESAEEDSEQETATSATN